MKSIDDVRIAHLEQQDGRVTRKKKWYIFPLMGIIAFTAFNIFLMGVNVAETAASLLLFIWSLVTFSSTIYGVTSYGLLKVSAPLACIFLALQGYLIQLITYGGTSMYPVNSLKDLGKRSDIVTFMVVLIGASLIFLVVMQILGKKKLKEDLVHFDQKLNKVDYLKQLDSFFKEPSTSSSLKSDLQFEYARVELL